MLTPCPECGRQISDQAPWCPHCGRPLASPPPRPIPPPPRSASPPPPPTAPYAPPPGSPVPPIVVRRASLGRGVKWWFAGTLGFVGALIFWAIVITVALTLLAWWFFTLLTHSMA
jgi:hypothetical protein